MAIRFAVAALMLTAVASQLHGQQRKWGVAVVGFGGPTNRSATVTQQVGTGTAVTAGADVLIRYRIVGVHASFVTGSFSADSGTEAVGDLQHFAVDGQLGIPEISILAGYGSRRLKGGFSTRTWNYIRAGGSSEIEIGTSNVFVGAQVAAYVNAREDNGATTAKGLEVQTRVCYRVSGSPLVVGAGYRFESLEVEGTDIRPEETRAVYVVAGLAW